MEVLFDSQNVEEFFTSFCRYPSITLHIDLIRGKNSHHIAEAIFKAFARAIKEAISIDDKKKNIIPQAKESFNDRHNRLWCWQSLFSLFFS